MDLPFMKEALTKLFSKPSCAMYPAVPSEAAPNYRGRIKYHPERCIGCGMCERVCAGGAIKRTLEPLEDGSTKVTLSFNHGSCTFCATCADFCHEKAIELTRDYHIVATKEEDLIETGSFIKPAPKKKAPPAAKPAAPAETPAAAPVKAADKPAEAAPAFAPRGDGKPAADPSKCVYCTLCAKKCPVGALSVDRAAKTWTLDEDACIGCGTCEGTCPKKAIVI